MARSPAQNVNRKIQPILEKYVAALQTSSLRPRAIYLFGSYAHGKPTWESDIDLAVISNKLTGHPINDSVRLMLLRRGIDSRIEPHPFRPEDFTEDNPEAAEIMRTGIRIL